MESKVTTLKNNIEVFYKKNLNTPRIALCLNMSFGAPEKSAGIHVMMSRLFMQGTKNRTAQQLAEELDKYAIEFSPELRNDYFRFRFVCLNEDFEKAIEIMTDVIKNPTFEDFEKELVKMTGEIIAEMDSPRSKVMDAYYDNMFENHSYGSGYTRILKNAENLKKQDIIDAYNLLINNSRKVITIIGDLEFDEMKSTLEENFGTLPESVNSLKENKVLDLNEPKIAEIIKPDANQAHIQQGWIVPTYSSEDYAVLSLLNVILGASGLSSRLFLELRDKKGLAYVVRSSYELFGECGNFSIYIATEPKNIEVCLEGFKEEIEKIKTTPIAEEELQNAKNNIIGKWAFLRETNNKEAALRGHHQILGLGFDFNDKAKEKIRAVTAEQIQECANKYFNDNYVLAVLKP